jgi:pimeloyl-ACP methyl ester carboxylesterase
MTSRGLAGALTGACMSLAWLIMPVAAARAAPAAEAFLLRGLFNVFSLGLDELGLKLRAAGVAAEVEGFGGSDALAQRIVRARSAGGPQPPLVLIGHSLGANEVLRLARVLGSQGVVVDLVVTIDPTAPEPVPANVRRAVNYFISGGIWGAAVSPEPKFRGSLTNADLAGNRRDLAASGDGHVVIDKNPAIHREIVGITRALRRPGRR